MKRPKPQLGDISESPQVLGVEPSLSASDPWFWAATGVTQKSSRGNWVSHLIPSIDTHRAIINSFRTTGGAWGRLQTHIPHRGSAPTHSLIYLPAATHLPVLYTPPVTLQNSNLIMSPLGSFSSSQSHPGWSPPFLGLSCEWMRKKFLYVKVCHSCYHNLAWQVPHRHCSSVLSSPNWGAGHNRVAEN